MEPRSRTANTLRITVSMMVYTGILICLQLVSRRVFLYRLGTEVLGLNTTAGNLLQLLNVAELGVAASVGYALYKPLKDNNREAVREIVALQGCIYRRVAMVIIAAAAVLMCFFPVIFDDLKAPLWYAYGSFGVMLFGSMLTYFLNYKELVLMADQREDKIVTGYRVFYLLKLVAQALTVQFMDNPYLWWLALEALFVVLASLSLQRLVRRNYPYLSEPVNMTMRQLISRYPEIARKTRQLFIHRISFLVLTQAQPVVIYACISMSMVAIYGNYAAIVTGLMVVCTALSGGVVPSMGNLVAEGDRARILGVFGEYSSLRFYIGAVEAVGLIMLSQPIIDVWIGAQYRLPIATVALIAAIFFLQVKRLGVEAMLAAYGRFGDVWAPVIETAVNLGLSITLGFRYGLNGVLGGVLISLVMITEIWRPYYLFRRAMHRPLWFYWRMYLGQLACGAVAGAVLWLSCDFLGAVGATVTFAVALGLAMCALRSWRALLLRLWTIVARRH